MHMRRRHGHGTVSHIAFTSCGINFAAECYCLVSMLHSALLGITLKRKFYLHQLLMCKNSHIAVVLWANRVRECVSLLYDDILDWYGSDECILDTDEICQIMISLAAG